MIKLFLDSGAFSAKYRGTPIDIDEYMAFIDKNNRYIENYANLDVIGDPKQCWENQKIMESNGFSPLPIFHMEDEVKPYLYRCLDYEYFCLGGMAKEPMRRREQFFNKNWGIICGTKNGFPSSRVHGFGLTSRFMIRRYPWYSVDSTSWVMYGKYGIILIPPYDHLLKCYRYDMNPFKIVVSTKSPLLSDASVLRKKHLYHFDKKKREAILNYIKEKGFILGKSTRDREGKEMIIEEGVSNNHSQRDSLNLRYFLDFEKTLKWPWPWRDNSLNLFGSNPKPANCTSEYKKRGVRVYYAGNFPQMKSPQLEREQMERSLKLKPTYFRLISFFYQEECNALIKLKREVVNESKKSRIIKRTKLRKSGTG